MCVAIYKWFDFLPTAEQFHRKYLSPSNFNGGYSRPDPRRRIHNTKSDTASTSKLISEYKEGEYRIVVDDLSNKRQKNESREEHRERIKTQYRENLSSVCDYSATP